MKFVRIQKHYIAGAAVMAAVFLLMLWLTALCPYITDDWHFKFVWRHFTPSEDDTRIRSVRDILVSMQVYYRKSGGRVVCHFLTYCLDNINLWVYRILNAGMFVLLGREMYLLIAGTARKKANGSVLLVLVYLALLLFLPSFGDVCLWLSGSVNYLWSSVLMMFCIRRIDRDFHALTFRKALLLAFPVMLSAATNEVTGGILILFMLLTAIGYGKKLLSLVLLPMAAALPGMLLVIAAPGNSVRAEKVDQVSVFHPAYMFHAGLFYFDRMTSLYFFGIIVLLFTAMLCVDGTKGFWRSLAQQFRYSIAGVAGIMALSASGTCLERAMMFGAVLLLTAIFRAMFRTEAHLVHKKSDTALLPRILRGLYVDAVFVEMVLLMKIYYHFGKEPALLSGAVLAVVMVILLYRSGRDGERLAETLRQFRDGGLIAFLRRLAAALDRKMIPVMLAAAVICSGAVAYQTVLYCRNMSAENRFLKAAEASFRYDGAEHFSVPEPDFGMISSFFPQETFNNSDTYSLSWMYLYYCGGGAQSLR